MTMRFGPTLLQVTQDQVTDGIVVLTMDGNNDPAFTGGFQNLKKLPVGKMKVVIGHEDLQAGRSPFGYNGNLVMDCLVIGTGDDLVNSKIDPGICAFLTISLKLLHETSSGNMRGKANRCRGASKQGRPGS